jgi:hypothetical protein
VVCATREDPMFIPGWTRVIRSGVGHSHETNRGNHHEEEPGCCNVHQSRTVPAAVHSSAPLSTASMRHSMVRRRIVGRE